MSDYVLQLKNINKYFGKNHVIKNVNLNFEKAISLPSWGLPAAEKPHCSA